MSDPNETIDARARRELAVEEAKTRLRAERERTTKADRDLCMRDLNPFGKGAAKRLEQIAADPAGEAKKIRERDAATAERLASIPTRISSPWNTSEADAKIANLLAVNRIGHDPKQPAPEKQAYDQARAAEQGRSWFGGSDE